MSSTAASTSTSESENATISTDQVPWIPEPSTVNNKLKRREGSGSTGRFFDETAPTTKQN
jgi:hypothetical protein